MVSMQDFIDSATFGISPFMVVNYPVNENILAGAGKLRTFIDYGYINEVKLVGQKKNAQSGQAAGQT